MEQGRNRVLVVDDDQVVLISCRRVLEPEGWEVDTASSAEKALALLAENNYEFMLVDVMMPQQDGIELMALARKARPGLPVILMTGFLTPQVRARGMDAGAAGFIPKPFTPEELLEGLRGLRADSPA